MEGVPVLQYFPLDAGNLDAYMYVCLCISHYFDQEVSRHLWMKNFSAMLSPINDVHRNSCEDIF
jgi:hypothetical protein